MKRLFVPVAFLLCAWALATSPVAADEPKKKESKDPAPAAVPFELLKTQHMVVNVKINGKGPYRLIFDTGAPVTLINNKVAKEAEVLPKDFKPPIFALFGSVGQFKMKSLGRLDLSLPRSQHRLLESSSRSRSRRSP